MNTEDFIRDAASRGWSKTQTREALGLGTQKFWMILRAMPPLEWASRGRTAGNKRGNASRHISPAILSALERARSSRRSKALVTWGERSGTIEELAEFAPVSARTIRRRLTAGWSIDRAFSDQPDLTMPTADWSRLTISSADIQSNPITE